MIRWQAAREAVGPNIDICADMHGRYDAITGEKAAKILEPLNMMWLEEPIAAENTDAYKKITDSTSTPICAGENHYLAYGFRPLLEDGAVDIIMPDLQKAGGLGEAQRIANLANFILCAFCSTYGSIIPRSYGFMPCMCLSPQFYDSRMADLF